MTTGSSRTSSTPTSHKQSAGHSAGRPSDRTAENVVSAGSPFASRGELGRSPLYAAKADQRFSYCLYRPSSSPPDGLLVAVHGTERDAVGTRDQFLLMAERLNLAILAPLFPAAIDDPDDLDNYKFIEFHGIRFDHLLLAMVDEATERLGLVGTLPIYLFGFSGGAQFALRFFFLHAEQVAAVSIAAPGRITEIDDSTSWWHGTADMAAIFGNGIDLRALAAVPVHMVVGSEDRTPSADRVAKAERLEANLRANGVSLHLDVVDGVRHELGGLVPAVVEFFEDVSDRAPPA